MKTGCLGSKLLITIIKPKLIRRRSPENDKTQVRYKPDSKSQDYIEICALNLYIDERYCCDE